MTPEEAARQIAGEMAIPVSEPMTDEQVAEFRRLWEELNPVPFVNKVMPLRLAVTDIREWLKDNVTVVQPGETLVIRVEDFTPAHIRELMDWMNYADENGPILPFRTVVVPGAELGVVRDDDEAFAARVAKAVGTDAVQRAIGKEALRRNMVNPARFT